MPHPASEIPFPCSSATPCTSRSSNAMREYRDSKSLAVLFSQSFLVFAILEYTLATLNLAFLLLLPPNFFLDRFLCTSASVFAYLLKCFGFLIRSPSEVVANVIRPISMPTCLPWFSFGITRFVSAVNIAYHLSASLFRVNVLIFPSTSLCFLMLISPNGVTLSLFFLSEKPDWG